MANNENMGHLQCQDILLGYSIVSDETDKDTHASQNAAYDAKSWYLYVQKA